MLFIHEKKFNDFTGKYVKTDNKKKITIKTNKTHGIRY